MVRGVYPHAMLTDGMQLITWSNQTLNILVEGIGQFFVDSKVNGICNSALITAYDGVAANGLSCFIDGFLLPQCDLFQQAAAPMNGSAPASPMGSSNASPSVSNASASTGDEALAPAPMPPHCCRVADDQ